MKTVSPTAGGFCRLGSRRGGRDGAVLAAVLIVVMLLGVLAVTMLKTGEYVGVEATRDIFRAKAAWTAEAGIEHAQTVAQKVRKPFGFSQYAGFPGNFFGANVLIRTNDYGIYTVSVNDDPSWTNAVHVLKKYIITSRGVHTAGGMAFTNTITVRAAMQSFASYMHASNFETQRDGSPLWWTTGDVIDGPVYVNDRLNVQGTPVFSQMVWSAAGSVNYGTGGNASAFKAGLTLNATPISGQFTGDHITDIKNQAQSGGQVLTNDHNIVFLPDGKFTYQRTTGGAVTTNTLSALTNGAIYVNGSATIRGVVNGRVTLAAQRSIFITNDIVYQSATNPNPWSPSFNKNNVDDYLGLVASNSVVITMTNNVNIHAAIMVTSGAPSGLEGFSALYNAYDLRVDGNRPDIQLYGSLSQYRRGLIWSGSANGFDKVYKFDTRFYDDAPPSFPYSIYVFTEWTQAED